MIDRKIDKCIDRCLDRSRFILLPKTAIYIYIPSCLKKIYRYKKKKKKKIYRYRYICIYLIYINI